jgi:flagellar assembly factor FliW
MDNEELTPTRAKGSTRGSVDVLSEPEQPETLEIYFPDGLIGCPTWRHFQLSPVPFEVIGELVCTDEDGVGLIVADPAWLQVDYNFELDAADAQAVALAGPEDARLFCILMIQRNPALVYANLAGPLIINWQRRIGRQVVLDHESYPLRAPVLSGATAQGVLNALFEEDVADESPQELAADTMTGRDRASHFPRGCVSGKGA